MQNDIFGVKTIKINLMYGFRHYNIFFFDLGVKGGTETIFRL